MIRKLIGSLALLAAVMTAGCDLEVKNATQPETERVLATPDDAEALLAGFYKRWSSGVYGSTTNLEGMANVMSVMNYSSLANNCQNNHAPFAGASNGNLPGNVCQGEQARLYQYMNEVNRVASDFLVRLADSSLNLTPLSPNPSTDARNLRAMAFAEFLRGLSLGYVSLMYDSSAVISPGLDTANADECVRDGITKVCRGRLKGYTEVFDSSMAAFQRAIDYTTAPVITGTNGFPLPGTWIPSPTSFTATEFARLIRSYRARIRANVARNPAQRAAVNWAAVVSDAQAGITADHYITTSTTVGPGNSWRQQYESFTTWHQMPPFVIGMADNSGNYAAWLAQPLGDRGAGNTNFFMTTPDVRFPQGATRAAQQADLVLDGANGCGNAFQACRRYFMNRPAADDQFSGAGWGWSQYDFIRFHSWMRRGNSGSARNGETVFFTKAELDLLQAEGLYRIGGQDGTVATLINNTRVGLDGDCDGAGPDVANNGIGNHPYFGTTCVAVGGGLPAVTAANRATPVAGGANCIPKVPGMDPLAPGDFTRVGCGDLWEALKYEKRIETAYTHYAPWFLDMRGWGDLPLNTPLFWPVPYQDLQARGRPLSALYGTGIAPGSAANSFATTSTYGW